MSVNTAIPSSVLERNRRRRIDTARSFALILFLIAALVGAVYAAARLISPSPADNGTLNALMLFVSLALGATAIYLMTRVGRAALTTARSLGRHGVLTVLVVFWLIPIFWLILCSFSVDKGPNIRSFFPEAYSTNHYRDLFGISDSVSQYPNWFKNSLIVAAFNCVISSSLVLMVAYAMSCTRFKARKPMMNFAIILNLFPGFLSMLAVYFVLKTVGLTDSNIGLIIVYSACSGLGYLVAKGFFDTIPKSLREAAMIEGASEATIFRKIVIPLSKPIIVYTVIGAFLSPWMDFIFANIMLPSKISSQKTVALGLYSMVNKVNINEYFGRFCAGGVLVSVPISILFIIMQKCYVEGVTGGSVKG